MAGLNELQDTIVAVSSPAGRSLRGVVRLSGPDALACAGARFTSSGDARWRRTFRATPGSFRLLGEPLRVPAVLYVMRAPHSYTRQDVVEAHVPGSPALLDLILDDLLGHGPGELRPAGPGEFTRRAFLNGRIDLARAEAVLAVIRARTERELLAATARLQGTTSRRCAEFQGELTELRATVEATLDFAPQGIELVPDEGLARRLSELRDRMLAELRGAADALASDASLHVAICGPPNAGKSSLLNRLAGAPVSIVHPHPGTTRDAVSAELAWGGARFRLYDTAGLSGCATGVDAEAVRRAREQVSQCQLMVLVLDGSVPLDPDTLRALSLPPPDRLLCVVNKCDLPSALDERELARAVPAFETVRTSALTGEGVRALAEALGRAVTEGRLDASAADCLFNARQRDAIRRAADAVGRAQWAIESGLGHEFAAADLREAADCLAEVTGGGTAQDVLDRIFSQFCIGK